jgi:drug/metabolite transporter (DMT)-like permease
MRQGRHKIKIQPFLELGIGLYLLYCLWLCLSDNRLTVGVPFLVLFMVGYFYVPLTTWFGHRLGRVETESEPAPASSELP